MTMHASSTPEDPVDTAMRYLLNGGLFNPESMNHEQVRDLVIRLRDAVVSARETANAERAAAERCAGERDDAHKVLEKLRRPLLSLIDTIDATGGIIDPRRGMWYPAADEEWVDLAEAYVEACAALGVTPTIHREDA